MTIPSDDPSAAYFHPVDPALYEDAIIGPVLRRLEAEHPDVIRAIAEVDRSLIQANLELTPDERAAHHARSLTLLSHRSPKARRDGP